MKTLPTKIDFTELEFGLRFYARPIETLHETLGSRWALRYGLTHAIETGYGSRRWCKFSPKRTRVYIAVDEAADGTPIMQKWVIRNVQERGLTED